MSQVKKLDRIRNNDYFGMAFLCDFDYQDKINYGKPHKKIPITEILKSEDKKYNKRVIRDVIKCFWDIVLDKMINDNYILLFPYNTIKMAIGSVNKFPKFADTKRMMCGFMWVCTRLMLKKKKVRGVFEVELAYEYNRILRRELKNGRKYTNFKLY